MNYSIRFFIAFSQISTLRSARFLNETPVDFSTLTFFRLLAPPPPHPSQLFFFVAAAAVAASLVASRATSAQQQQNPLAAIDSLAANIVTAKTAKENQTYKAVSSALNATFPGASAAKASARAAKVATASAINSTLSAASLAFNATFPGASAGISAAKAAKRSKKNQTLYTVYGALNSTFPKLTAAELARLKTLYENKLQCTNQPPLLFIPGLFGSYLAITVTPTGCAQIPQCVALGATDPSFVAKLTSGTPVVINDFFEKPDSTRAARLDLLVALLTQTYDTTTNTLNYSPGVAVASNGTAAGAYCNGVSKTYKDNIIDAYLVKQVGYRVGTNLACLPYNWELDMPGLQQDGSFALFERLVRALYLSPANDPPMPGMPRKKVVVMGHSMGTLFSTSALQVASPEVQAMVDQVILLSPVSAGAALTWQLTLYGGFEPALAFKTVLPDPLPEEEKAKLTEPLRYLLWSLAQIGAVNPTLAPYDLPPYAFKRLKPPQFPNGFPAAQSVADAVDLADPNRRPPPVDVTVATQAQSLQGPLFVTPGGPSRLSYLNSIWARSHSYDGSVAFWSSPSTAPANVTIQCAYGVAVKNILTAAARVPFPFPANTSAGFSQIEPDKLLQADGLGDGIVNLQGNNGCDRMADNTGGFVFPCTSPDCEHILMVENKPGSRAFLNTVLPAAGINPFPVLPTPPWCGAINTTQVVG